MAWLRLYDTIPHDPKAQSLPGELFKFWVNALCLSKKYDGRLPDLPNAAWSLRMSEAKLKSNLEKLVKADLFEVVAGVFTVHDWDHWQYPSDVSTERTRRFRERSRNVAGNGICSVSVLTSVSEEEKGPKISKLPETPLNFAERLKNLKRRWKKPGRDQLTTQVFTEAIVDGENFDEMESGLLRWEDYHDANGWTFCGDTLIDAVKARSWEIDPPPLVVKGAVNGKASRLEELKAKSLREQNAADEERVFDDAGHANEWT